VEILLHKGLFLLWFLKRGVFGQTGRSGVKPLEVDGFRRSEMISLETKTTSKDVADTTRWTVWTVTIGVAMTPHLAIS
jgi:hypothetical protein